MVANVSTPQSVDWTPNNGGGNGYVYTSPGSPATATTSGTVVCIIKYWPDGPNDKPPKKVWVREWAHAHWFADGGPAGAFSGTVSVGLAGQGEETSGPFYKQITRFKMTQVDGASGIITRSCSLDANVAGDGRDGPRKWKRMGTIIPPSMIAKFPCQQISVLWLSTKGVTISSDRDTTYHRGIENGVYSKSSCLTFRV